MDCGGLAAQQQQQQQQQNQQQQLSIQQQLQQQKALSCLEEAATITNINLKGILVGSAASGPGAGAGTGAGAGAVAPAGGDSPVGAGVKLRRHSDRPLTGEASSIQQSHTYRISMANLEDTQESELDQILGELSLLEHQISYDQATLLLGGAGGAANMSSGVLRPGLPPGGGGGNPMASMSASSSRSHSRTNSTISADVSSCSSSGVSENGHNSSAGGGGMMGSHQTPPPPPHPPVAGMTMGITLGVVTPREPRTESPDNDSAFSDTVSLLSSESSASSNASLQQQQIQQQQQLQQQQMGGLGGGAGHGQRGQVARNGNNISKAAKIQLALHKLEHPSIRRLFVKAFTADGASKSLLVDERMICGHVTRLLADKNHVQMQPVWSLVEHLGDLQMERLFEDHELLVDNLMNWNSDGGNRVLFQQRADKVALFARPELYLPGPQMAPGCQHDDQTRHMLLDEFFEAPVQPALQLDGPLYMKADPKKGWKRYHFVLRTSGLYYFPKEKTKNTRDLACLTLFQGHNVYTGLGWRKKWKAPTDFTFGFKAAVDSSLGKSCRSLKMLCAEDMPTLDRWLTAIRVCKYGKQLWHSHKMLLEDLCLGGGGSGNGNGTGSGGRSDGDAVSQSSFAASMRSESISSISSAVPSQCGSVSSAISSMSSTISTSGRTSRASSSSSSGCLSDDNNGFDSEFTTGTIKRKPSMKPNLPLTTMTRQLKEVGEITICESAGGDAASSPERSGTLTRRHSRRKSQESNGSGTLKRRPVPVVKQQQQQVAEPVAMGGSASSNSSSSNSTPTPTPSICAKPPPGDVASMMCSSTLSLDSLPPPPPPVAFEGADEQDVYGSQLSLASLPPPPPPEDVLAMTYAAGPSSPATPTNINPAPLGMGMGMSGDIRGAMPNSNGALPPAVPAKPVKPAGVLKAAPPYKAPPDYVGPAYQQQQMQAGPPLPPPPPAQKKVSFADSPVLLRRKMCSPEPVLPQRSPSTTLSCHSSVSSGGSGSAYHIYAPGPMLPPRTDLARLSSQSNGSSSGEVTSPKRLQESASNPPRDFLKDLQRVMRKKWQVAQKCKLEPATTPHEVLGFRDFSNEDLLAAHNLNSGANSSHYYRETANVSHWVREHYEYAHNALYENVHGQTNGAGQVGANPMLNLAMNPGAGDAAAGSPPPPPPPAMGAAKKRPPPPPPKRSDKTHLTNRV
ncbi:ras-associated and pleckstrin homology domains-containing protein 1 isoform X1 [Drosophila ananassae]|uniref:ras-associated and pleckstrin homology domains-containing protein 1 isoform X1 n=2 Tax=Drosophila ananassae TaxID=7217 RepID=UPI0013A5D4FB|nr:ras-associated and pleckstrin homology domains-containing protein 1 isoform X1 [Drosophila ananassae]